MKNKKKKTILAAFCGALALAAAFCGVSALNKGAATAEAATAEIAEGQIEEKYAYGTKFALPESVRIQYGEEEYTAEKGYIVYPDGFAYAGSEEYILDSIGEYTVVYETEVDGKILSAEQNFSVKADLYSLDADSSLTYDTLRAFSIYEDMTPEQKAAGGRMGDLKTDVKGLNVYLSSGNVFTYNKPINVYENTSNDIIAMNVIQLEPVVQSWKITLTDCYDPSITVEFAFRKSAIDYTCVRMSAYGRASVGLAESKTTVGDVYIDGKPYNKDNNGAPVKSNRSIDVTTVLNQDRYNNWTLRLDTTDKKALKAYMDCKSARGEEPGSYLIAEFNNDKLFGYTFDGFTNGDVYLSVTASDFNGVEQGEIEICSIMGASGEDLLPKDLTDADAPEIVVDAPTGKLEIVAGSPIAVPQATARDISGLAGDVDYTVWYGYETENKRMIQIKDGKFTPDVMGKYTVEYFVTDVHGNKATALLELNAVREGVDPITFTCNQIANVAAGEYVTFDGYTVDTLTELRSFTTTVTCPNGEEIAIENPAKKFQLEGAGTYTVKYAFVDTFYQGEYVYTFEAEDRGIYSFADDIVLPKYLIRNATYSFEVPTLYKYTGATPVNSPVKAYIRYGSGEYSEIDPASVTITGKNRAFVKFVCADDETVMLESEEITVMDVNYGKADFDKSQYFVGDFTAATSKEQSDRTVYTYKFTSTSKPELEFINVLSLNEFGMRFTVPADQKTKAVTLILTDYYDRTNTAELEISQDTSGNYFSYNGGAKERVSETFVGTPLTVLYKDGVLSVGPSKIPCPINFTTDLCLLKVKITGLTNGNRFDVLSVCNQQFGYYVKSDTAKPIISADIPNKIAKVGDVIEISKPVCADVLSPSAIANCTVSVYRNGKVIKSTEGIDLKDVSDFDKGHKFEISDYGSYLIAYEYVDGAGKKADVRYTITVTDVIAPTFEWKNYNGSVVEVKVDEITPIMEYTVSDNYTAEEDLDVWVFVYNYKGICVSADKNTLTVTEAGRYTVRVYCIDDAGNSTAVEYEIKAK